MINNRVCHAYGFADHIKETIVVVLKWMFMVQTQVLICAFLNNWININESTPLNGKKGNMKCSKEKQLSWEAQPIAHGMDTRIF